MLLAAVEAPAARGGGGGGGSGGGGGGGGGGAGWTGASPGGSPEHTGKRRLSATQGRQSRSGSGSGSGLLPLSPVTPGGSGLEKCVSGSLSVS